VELVAELAEEDAADDGDVVMSVDIAVGVNVKGVVIVVIGAIVEAVVIGRLGLTDDVDETSIIVNSGLVFPESPNRTMI